MFLESDTDGNYIVTLRGETLLSTKLKSKAIKEYNSIRRVLESEFPQAAPDAEDMRAILLKEIGMGELEGLKSSNLSARKKRQRSRTFG